MATIPDMEVTITYRPDELAERICQLADSCDNYLALYVFLKDQMLLDGTKSGFTTLRDNERCRLYMQMPALLGGEMRKRDVVLDGILDGVADGFDMEGGYHETGQCNSSLESGPDLFMAMFTEACARERAEASEPIMIDSGDVTISQLEPFACENCGEDPVTHEVILDLRHMGETTSLLQGCAECCDDYAVRLRKGLPQGMKPPVG